VEWAEEWAEKWYGEKLAARRTRPRAQAIQDAWDGDPEAGMRLVEQARTETNIIWKASLIRLMQPYVNQQDVAELVQEALRDDHELIRSAAIHVLGAYPAFHPRLTHLRKDTSRLVRLDAAWATRGGEPMSAETAAELEAWLRFNSDQPAGALNMAQYALSQGNAENVAFWAERMLTYDASQEPVQLAARLLHASGDSQGAITTLETALEDDDSLVECWYMLGMLRGEASDLEGAMDAFRRVVVTSPEDGRAWYNLGLAHVQTGNRNAGIIALEKAEATLEAPADASYALATVYLQDGEPEKAGEAIDRALEADPRHGPSLQLRRSLP
jgi:tetratricopeptide (TPR) repeat protein